MPTYDYRCDACGHAFDAFQSITEPALKKCPKCGKNKLRRLIGAGAGIIFKGSGFYETDYKRSRTSSSESPESSEKKTNEARPAESKSAGPAPEKPSKKKKGSK